MISTSPNWRWKPLKICVSRLKQQKRPPLPLKPGQSPKIRLRGYLSLPSQYPLNSEFHHRVSQKRKVLKRGLLKILLKRWRGFTISVASALIPHRTKRQWWHIPEGVWILSSYVQFVVRLTTPLNISKNTLMMHITVSAPQRLPPHPLLNNFHLMYGSKCIVCIISVENIVSVLQLQINIRFNLHCYSHYFLLFASRELIAKLWIQVPSLPYTTWRVTNKINDW